MKKAVKILSLFVLMATMLPFTSCSKENKIVGKWQLVSMVFYYGEQSYDMTDWVDDVLVLEFKADGTYYESDEYLGTYEYSGDKLKFIDEEGDVEEVTVTQLTNTKMVLEVSDYDEEDDMTYLEVMEFKRI